MAAGSTKVAHARTLLQSDINGYFTVPAEGPDLSQAASPTTSLIGSGAASELTQDDVNPPALPPASGSSGDPTSVTSGRAAAAATAAATASATAYNNIGAHLAQACLGCYMFLPDTHSVL